MAYNYIPKYIRQSENKSPKSVVTAARWNELFNLLIKQGDHTAEELGKILNYFSTRLVDVESEISESAEAIANIREVFRINVTFSNGVYSADKTFAEIKAAYEAGQQPYVVYGGDTIYTLSYCYFASEQMFMNFERYLIGEDTLKTETLRIYSYTTDSGSNIVKRTSSFDVPSGATYIAVDSTDNAIFTVNGETYADIQALINAGKPVVVRFDDDLDFYYFETFGFSDSSGIHKRLNFRCVMGSIVYTLALKDDNTWAFSETSLQSKSITDTGSYFTTDTVEGALQEIGAGLAHKQDKLIAGENITIDADGKTISATGGGSTVELDTTLTESGKAADAKAVGDALTGKQDTISDLEAIRTGATKGATALQSVPNTYRTAAAQDVIDSGKVDKVTDKGLSSNDYTDAAKAKVDALAPVATSGSYDDLTNKPTIPAPVTEQTVSGWGFTKNTGTYSKPSSGIPKADLAAAVQTSLGKADTALQEHQSLAAYRKAAAQDAIDAQKQSIITDLETIRSGAAKGATALQSVPATYRTAAAQDVIDNTKLTDAPTDGKAYARKNGSWHEIAVADVDALQSKSITDSGGHFTTDTVEGALQEIGAELAGINTLLGSGIQISFTLGGTTCTANAGETWIEWVGSGYKAIENGMILSVHPYSDEGVIFLDEAGVYALSLDGNTPVHGGDKIISGGTYTSMNWGG